MANRGRKSLPGSDAPQYYAGSKAETLKRLANDELDLLITSHHTRLPPELQQPLRVHRLIIDESEWFEPGPYSKYKDIGLIRQLLFTHLRLRVAFRDLERLSSGERPYASHRQYRSGT